MSARRTCFFLPDLRVVERGTFFLGVLRCGVEVMGLTLSQFSLRGPNMCASNRSVPGVAASRYTGRNGEGGKTSGDRQRVATYEGATAMR